MTALGHKLMIPVATYNNIIKYNNNKNNNMNESRVHRLFFLLLFVSVVSLSVSASKVVELTSETFEHETQASTGQTTGKWFIKFYTPWCGHCKKLAPTWDELAEAITSDDVDDDLKDFVIANVDCTQHKGVCDRFGVQGYPTLKLIANHQVYDYKGSGRGLEDLTNFLAKGGDFGGNGSPVPPPPSWLEQMIAQHKELSELVDDFNHVVLVRKNAAAVLVAIGVIWGMSIMFFFQMILGGGGSSKAAKAKATKTTKKKD
jgi:protein disulfide-isomerase-like protein